MLEEANEVQDVLGRSYGMPEIDEDELEGQLDALLDDMALVGLNCVYQGFRIYLGERSKMTILVTFNESSIF